VSVLTHCRRCERRKMRRDAATTSTDRIPQAFGLSWEDKYLPHYLTVGPSKFHEKLTEDLGTFHIVRGQKRAYRGPRGSGKTSHLSKAYPLHCAVEGNEQFILLTSETGPGQAEAYLAAIKAELEGNERLAKDYPHACGVGSLWQSDRIKLRNGVTIVAKGSGSRLLGMADRNVRPTLVIGDDLNARSDAYSPTVRDRRLVWWKTDVMNIGTPGHTNFIVAGTAIHDEAVVCELSRMGTWQSAAYKSIIEWPKRMDLWQEWERRLTNLADAERSETARKFYDENSHAMNDGAEVLWPEYESLYELMTKRADIGPAAFGSEKQDEPGIDGATEFPPEWLTEAILFDDWPSPNDTVLRVIACDPSKGADAKAGDYQSIPDVRLTRDGVLWADCSMKREAVPLMCERFALMAKDGRCDYMAIEVNATLGLLLTEVERAMKAVGVKCPLAGINNVLSKAARIRRLGGYLSRGHMRIRNTPGGKMLLKQLRQFPNGDHDDGPDGLEIGVRQIEDLIRGK
jgi:predicted phage terminase large subunit-like protein